MRGCIGKDPNLQLALNKRVVFWKGGRNGQFRVKEVYSLLHTPMTPLFQQVVFGWLQFQPRLHSLFGRLRGGGCSLLIGSRKEDGSFLIVVICVGVKKKL